MHILVCVGVLLCVGRSRCVSERMKVCTLCLWCICMLVVNMYTFVNMKANKKFKKIVHKKKKKLMFQQRRSGVFSTKHGYLNVKHTTNELFLKSNLAYPRYAGSKNASQSKFIQLRVCSQLTNLFNRDILNKESNSHINTGGVPQCQGYFLGRTGPSKSFPSEARRGSSLAFGEHVNGTG